MTSWTRKAIQTLSPKTRAFVIHEHNRYKLSEYTLDGGYKDVGVGSIDKLYDLAKIAAEAEGGIVVCYGGGKMDLNFTKFTGDEPEVVRLADMYEEAHRQKMADQDRQRTQKGQVTVP